MRAAASLGKEGTGSGTSKERPAWSSRPSTESIDPLVTVANDEIYEKYLQKAITEINTLGDEVAQAGGGTRVPVVGSGHPLAEVMLLKYAPRPSELQEGVAFFGRAGIIREWISSGSLRRTKSSGEQEQPNRPHGRPSYNCRMAKESS